MTIRGDLLDGAGVLIKAILSDLPDLGPRPFGLTWQDRCSREAHEQMWQSVMGYPPPPGMFASDPPSVTRPPGE